MRPQNRYLFVFLALLMLATNPASTQQEKSGEKTNPYVKRFQELDADDDGSVSLAEWPLEEAKFHIVDRNKDGSLSPTELLTPTVLRRGSREEQFRRLDSNRDGRLSPRESQRAGEDLERQDRNRDGYVTPFEYQSGSRTWNPTATLQDRRRFQTLDRNLDNRLTRSELRINGAAFNRLDRNRDGVISPSEWQ
jgi:hypothetical protein